MDYLCAKFGFRRFGFYRADRHTNIITESQTESQRRMIAILTRTTIGMSNNVRQKVSTAGERSFNKAMKLHREQVTSFVACVRPWDWAAIVCPTTNVHALTVEIMWRGSWRHDCSCWFAIVAACLANLINLVSSSSAEELCRDSTGSISRSAHHRPVTWQEVTSQAAALHDRCSRVYECQEFSSHIYGVLHCVYLFA